MDDQFKIFVEQLRHGHVEEIEIELPCEFLDVHEKDLVYEEPIHVKGRAYLAEKELLLHFDIETEAQVPCSICNDKVTVPVMISNWLLDVPLEEIKTGVYSFKEPLRETILLETPSFAECGGNCPQRREVKKYLKEPSSTEESEGYHPFADL